MKKYVEASKRCKKEIQRFHLAKESRILETSTQSSIFRYIRSRLSSRSSVVELEHNGVSYDRNEEMVAILNEQYCSVFSVDDANLPELPVRARVDIDDHIITRADVIASIRELKSNSAGGVDGIPAYFYKTFSTQLSVPLQMISQRSFETGILPKEWKMSIVTCVYKGKGCNKSVPVSYRPISLTCIACRIMERILKVCITMHCEYLNLFSSEQHGFRSKRSTETQLLECVNDWTKSLDAKECVDIFT